MMAEGSSAFFREDRSWMYAGRRSRDLITPEWAEKTTEFVERAFHRVSPDRAARGVLCPCARCGNTRPRSKHDMQMHLCKHGFRPGYMVWVYHGESPSLRPAKLSDEQSDQNEGEEEDDELADFWGEEEEVSSKPQGAMKREISLIQAYAYSKLRKEDQIEWDYQKYLWEKEKLQKQQNAAERPATHPADCPPILSRGQSRRSTFKNDHEFDAAYDAAYDEYQVAFQEHQAANTVYMQYVNGMLVAIQTGQSMDLGPVPPMPGPAPMMPSRDSFARTYYALTPHFVHALPGGRQITLVHHNGPSAGTSPDPSAGASPTPSPGGSSVASTGCHPRQMSHLFTKGDLEYTPSPLEL